MKKISTILFTIALSVAITSCKKDNANPDEHGTTPTESTGSMTLKFENKFGATNLVLDNVKYTNNTDTFYVNTFNYYIRFIVKNNKGLTSEVSPLEIERL